MGNIKFTLDPKVKKALVYKLSELLTFLIVEKKIKANDMAVRLGINTAALSFLKNNKCKELSDMRVIIAAVSFNIEVEGFLSNFYLVELRSGGNALSGHSLGSNLYHVEIEEFKSWVHKTEKTLMEDWKKDEANAALTGERVHQEFEQNIGNGSMTGKSLTNLVIPGFESKSIHDAVVAKRFDASKYVSKQTAEEISKCAGTIEIITTERDELNHILADYDRLKKRRDDLNQILTLMKNNLL